MPNHPNTQATILRLIQENGGYFAGHTVFRNGYHAEGWIEKGALIHNPRALDYVSMVQAQHILEHFPDIELVIGTPNCGAIVAHNVARHLNVRLAFTKKDVEVVQTLEFHRMYRPPTGKKVVLIDDMVCTGHDIRQHIRFLQAYGMTLLGISVWMNRQEAVIDGITVLELLPMPFAMFPAEDCPLCQQGVEIKYHDIRE